jgi:hypothetical protein
MSPGETQYASPRERVWEATPELRWQRPERTTTRPCDTLQQKWIADDGCEEWRDVPLHIGE